MLSRAHMRIVGAVCAAAALMLVAGCTVSTGDNTGSSSSAVTTTPTSEALVTVTPADGGTPVSPLDPIEVQVAKGTLTTVALTNPEGKEVAGITTPDKPSWKPSEPLGYGKTYKLVVDAVDANGVATTKNTTLTTVAPSNQTRAYINTTGGASISDGGTYGVGTVVAGQHVVAALAHHPELLHQPVAQVGRDTNSCAGEIRGTCECRRRIALMSAGRFVG